MKLRQQAHSLRIFPEVKLFSCSKILKKDTNKILFQSKWLKK